MRIPALQGQTIGGPLEGDAEEAGPDFVAEEGWRMMAVAQVRSG
jgi:hypothetical protein